MHHSKSHFYKYLITNAAKAVLTNKSVKWSSPILFNDPFDMPTKFDFDFSGEELAEALLEEQVRLVFSDEEPAGNIDHPFFAMILLSRKNRHKSTPDQFREFMRKSAFETAQRFQFGLSKIREYWEYFRTNTRLFCVSEVNDDILMWAHYAENHEGAVVKIRCLCDQDRPLCAAIQVNYRDEYPLISKLEKYVKHLTGQDKLNYDNLFREFISTKSTHWRYEREWRCVGLKNEGSEGLFHYETIIPEELEAIYLGCRINSTDEQELIHILDDNFPDTEIYRAKTVEQKFKIQFEKIR